MSNFIYSTQINIDGPWLIDRAGLQHLGKIIDEISNKFSEASEERIDAELPKILDGFHPDVRDRKRDEYRENLAEKYKLSKKITLSLSNSKYVKAASIDQLISQPELLDELPTEFEAEIETYHRRVRVKLEKGMFGGTASLNIRTSPETDELAREAFMELQHWAVTNQAPVWQRVWANNYWVCVWIWVVALFVSMSLIPSNSENIQQDLKPIAIQILKDGISNEEMSKAIELLLRIEFKEPITEVKHPLPTWFRFLFFGGLAAVVALWFRPSLELGIGRSVARIKRWRGWIRFIGITLPSFIFGSILWPYFSELIGFTH